MNRFYRQFGKRALDLCVATALLGLLSPLMLAIGALVWINLGSPVLFVHERPGRDAIPFRLFKFRTMRQLRDQSGRYLPDHERLTRFGGWLRATSLDELPELWNVVRGDMSLVGPRPLLTEYLPLYSPTQKRRHDVQPGITGWAQVNGRNAIGWEQRFEYDIAYVDRISLWMDIRILLATVSCVVRRYGISADTHCTMPPYMGGKCGGDGSRAAA